jgi:hypothetical protein
MCNTATPTSCPSCGEGLLVVKLECPECGTGVAGRYRMCPVCSLTGESRRLFNMFLESRGNLKDVQRKLGISYPTVRARIEELFRALGGGERHPLEILDDLHNGELSVERAVELLRGVSKEQGE